MAERVYVALDLETTGLDAKRDGIIEIGAVRFQGVHILDRFVTFVNPSRTIPLRVQQITNIRNSDVTDAPRLDDVIPELLAFVRSDVTAIIAHNADFDMGFLQAAGIHLQLPVLDTFELATILLPGAGSFSLGELCRTLQIDLTDAHRALNDAEATAQLFIRLQQQLYQVDLQTLQIIAASAEQSTWQPRFLFADALDAQPLQPVAPAVGTTRGLWQQKAEHPTLAPYPVESQSTVAGDQVIQQTVSTETIESFFATDGPLAQQFAEHFEVRRGQIDMAQQVVKAFNEGAHVLLEAGTGIGKSLAYLVPAALWSVANQQRVMIATNTITLQEQLLDKELPLLQKIFHNLEQPIPQAALLKGRQRYLCTRRLHSWRQSHRLSPVELTFLAKVLVWLSLTTTGEMEELFLATNVERSLWQEICSHPATCSEELCNNSHAAPDAHDFAYHDFFYLARQRAESANLLVINHALLIADLVTGGRLLPAYSHLIVDEAHHLDQVATEQLTYRAEWQWIFPMVQRLTKHDELLTQIEQLAMRRDQVDVLRYVQEVADDAQALLPQLQDFCDRLYSFVQHQRDVRLEAGYTQQIHLNQARRAQPQWSQIEIEWEQTHYWFTGLLKRLSALLQQLESHQWRDEESGALLVHTLRDIHEQLAELTTQLNAIILLENQGDAHGTITWAEVSEGGKGGNKKQGLNRFVSLFAAPLYINEILEKDLVLQQRTAIFTGATLRTGSGFTFIRDRLGLWHASALTVDSPFDYEWSTMLCMPGDMPAPDHPYYQAAVERAIIDAAVASEGRTLALFTSYAQLRATADAIRAELDRAGITVLEHGTSSRRRLLREYRQLDKAVLLGTRSFWEGVDLPGDELRCLLIVKLPFAVPSDPLVAARCSDLENPFGEYMLPDAILRFRQGFGRLIRRESDQGVVVLLDSRLWRKEYGQAFLESLPRCTVNRSPLSNLHGEIQNWLHKYE